MVFVSTGNDTERITLKRATTGTDLWPAVEAAQFARVISCPDPDGLFGRDVVKQFVAAFVDLVERWEDMPPNSRITVLAGLSHALQGLMDHGYFVHCGYAEREFNMDDVTGDSEMLTMPLAVLSIDRNDADHVDADIPANLLPEDDFEDSDGDPDV